VNCPRCHNIVRADESFCGNCGLPQSSPDATQTLTTESEVDNSAPDPFIGQILDSKYELIKRLGQGGMGAVYRARRKHIGDEVAIKILLDKFVAGHEAAERFRREARAAAMLRHPNVVTIHDFSDGAGETTPAYIVMELVEGTSLRDLLNREGRISPARSVTVMRGVCSGVGAAHRKGVIHRDLKPDNIIIAPPERAGEPETVKVIDFGIAKLKEVDGGSSLTQTGMLIGTPFYMSPEQCLGDPLDARSDVYSIGAILYEMLGGSPPFTGNTPTAVVAKHLTDTATPLDRLGVPLSLANVAGRALAKDPQERYQSVDDLFSDLVSAVGTPSPDAGDRRQTLLNDSAPTIASYPTPQTSKMQAPTVSNVIGVTQPVTEAVPVTGAASKTPSEAGVREQSLQTRAELSKRLRWARNLGIVGGVLMFILSVGVGFLLRWLGWANVGAAYDEVALDLMAIGLRDAIFGVFLGTSLSALRLRRKNFARPHWISSLITYAAVAATIAMLPFVLLRTSLFLVPVGFAIIGLVVGLISCGIKMLFDRFVKKHQVT
jgi:eukaryotic-like serine/threonine-protein kinase